MSTVIQSTFTGTDGTLLPALTLEAGGPWVKITGDWTVQSNKAAPPASTVNAIVWADAATGDITLTCDIFIPNDSNFCIGLAMRGVDASNSWFAVIEADGGTPYIGLTDCTSGTNTGKVQTNLVTATKNSTVTMTVVCSGTTISLTLSTGETVNYTSSLRQTATKMGLFAYTASGYSTNPRCDNFEADNGVTGTLPSSPTDLAVVAASTTQLNATWSDINSGSAEETAYLLELSTDNGGTWGAPISTSADATSKSLTGLTEGTKYAVRIAATNAIGTSTYSNPVFVYTLPSTPTGFSITGLTTSSIATSWTDVSANNTGNTLQYDTDSGFGTATNIDIPNGTTTMNIADDTFTPGTTYYARIRAYTPGSVSAWSSSDNADATGPSATLDQSTAIAGKTVTGTYANYTPDHAFAVTGQMSPATIALTNFSASAGNWSGKIPASLAGTDYEYFLNDSDNTNSVDLGQLQVTAALSTAYVRTDGSDSNDGSANDSGHAFSTLAHAVSVLSSGGSINIDEGSYDTTTIDATSLDDVTLTGRGSGLVNLVQTGTGAILDITSTTGWTISGINFDASADASTGWTVKADSTTNCTIDSCTGIGPEDGIVATNSVNIRVTNCTWNGYYDGANFTGSINPYFYNTTFATNSTIALVVDCHGAILDSIVGGLAVNCTFTGTRAAASTKRTIGALVGGASMTLSGCVVNASSSHSASTGAVVGLDDLTGGMVSKRLAISGTTFTTSAVDTNAAVLDIFNGLGVVVDSGGNTYSANKTIGPIRVAGNSVTEGWSIAGDYADWVSPITGAVTGVLLGAGGGCGTSSTGEGGGGGAARVDFTLNVIAGQKISIHVGSGGSINADGDYSYIFDGTGWNVLGTDITTTYFAGFGHKGSSGTGGAGGSDNGSSGTAHNGGAGGNGSSTDGGGGGGSGKSNAVGGNGSAGGVNSNAGGTGTWVGGSGGTTGASGYNGLGPGAGGGGGGAVANGGLGQSGQVLFSYLLLASGQGQYLPRRGLSLARI